MKRIDRRQWLRILASAPAVPELLRFQVIADEAPDAPLIGPRERIVFFGDSITQGGTYVAFLETLLRLRFPNSAIEIHNHGISSETISGTSEPDHNPRRPWAHERFTRDVADWHPTMLVSCFGMNDGNYHPFDESRFEKYREGIHRLIERATGEARVRRLILCTPPPFDPYQRKNGDPQAVHYGYKYPAVNYDDTLGRYARWLMSLREQRQTVVDLHTPMNRHLGERRKSRVSFTLMPDAVHPDATGHAVMAITLAKQLGLAGPRDCLTVSETFDSAKSQLGAVRLITAEKNACEATWAVPPRWRFGSGVDAESIALEAVAASFDGLKVKLEKPVEGAFEVTLMTGAGSMPVVRMATGQELSQGLLFAPEEAANDASTRAGETLVAAVMKHRQAASAQWRNRAMKLPKDAEERGPQLEELAMEAAAGAELSKLAGSCVEGARLKIRRLPT